MIKKGLTYLFTIGLFFPLFFLFIFSIGRNWQFPAIFPKKNTLDNWSIILKGNSELNTSLTISLLLSSLVAITITLLSFITSKYIAQSKHRSFLILLCYLPYVLAPVILGVLLQFYFIYTDLAGTFAGVFLAQLIITYPFGIIIFNNFWTPLVFELEKLTFTLGANTNQTFKEVLFPLSRKVLALCFFQVFLISWFEYGLSNLIGIGNVKTLTLRVFQYINEANIFYAALASCLLIIPPGILIWINKRFLFKAETIV
ncbi:ABC transporter permease subunit [Flavobacteriaceae bacterium R38]|nr:ABC transporter permease subunit [Flavobacteriaceae bacterium R38]